MLFTRSASAVDRLADVLRRADATWRGGELVAWDELSESTKEEWRTMALKAAAAVFEEVTGRESSLHSSSP
jgi:hypothetical protein